MPILRGCLVIVVKNSNKTQGVAWLALPVVQLAYVLYVYEQEEQHKNNP